MFSDYAFQILYFFIYVHNMHRIFVPYFVGDPFASSSSRVDIVSRWDVVAGLKGMAQQQLGTCMTERSYVPIFLRLLWFLLYQIQ